MRIPFNSRESLVLYVVVFCILACIGAATDEMIFYIASAVWLYVGNGISDDIIAKDWKGLRFTLLVLAAIGIIGVILVQTGVW